MHPFLRILLVLIPAIGLEAAPAVLDFSRSHTIQDVRRSGLKFKRLSDFGHSVAYVFEEERDIVVLLPGGRRISQRIRIAFIQEKDGILTHLDLRGGVMPQEQARQVAAAFCDSFNLTHDKLEGWYQRNLGRQYSVEDLSLSPNTGYYPRVTLGIGPSFSKLYPYSAVLLVTWNWDEHRDWDEERAWREFHAPAFPEISLNAPSGLKYDRADALKPFLGALSAAEEALAKNAKGTQAQGSGSGGTVVPPVATVSKDLEAPADHGIRWWLWIGGAAFLLAALWCAWITYRRKD